MTKRGFIGFAIDLSYNGASGVNARHIPTPEGHVENIHAAIDYLGTRPFVNRNAIGLIGICASGSFAIAAALTDTRIRAVTTLGRSAIRFSWTGTGGPASVKGLRVCAT